MEMKDTSRKKKRLLVLYLILGKLGVHRLFAGKYITGAVFLLVGGVAIVLNSMNVRFAYIAEIASAIITAADLYLICSGRFKDRDGNPVSCAAAKSERSGEDAGAKTMFINKINNIMYVAGGAAIYIGFCMIYHFAF
jgi:TM2 domain-containing membrane protein YozV